MIFRQVTHDDLGCASYFVGDENAGVAAVVDPKLDIGEYLHLARYFGVAIEHILETHNHADHVSGHGRLAAATGATIHIHAEAKPEYDHEPFDDGWVLDLGEVRVRALHTPGHRPEHTAFLLMDIGRGDEPVGGAHRRHAVRRRRGPARSGGGQGGGRRRNLPLAPRQAAVAARPRGGVARPSRRLAVRRAGHGHEGVLHHRLRARATTPTCRYRTRPSSSRKAIARLGPQPPNFKNIVGINRGPLAAGEHRGAPARAASGGERARRRARWWWTCAPTSSSTRRTSPERCRTRDCGPASVPSSRGSRTASSRSCSWARRRRRPPRDGAGGGHRAEQRRGIPRRGHDQLAGGEARGRRASSA